MIEGLIITIASVAALLTGLIWMIFIRSGRPKYKFSKKGEYKFVKSEVFAENEKLLSYYDADRVAKTAYALYLACQKLEMHFLDPGDLTKIKENLSNVAACLLTKPTFIKDAGPLSEHAISVYVQFKDKIYSKEIPCALVSEQIAGYWGAHGDYMAHGRPLIHEWIHGIELWTNGGYDYAHKDKFRWLTLLSEAESIFDTLDGERR